jgi:DNA-binding IclR family transcriptional regulator
MSPEIGHIAWNNCSTMRNEMALPTARTGTQSIDRAAELLVRVVQSESPISVGDLTESSGLPKSTTSRLVSALERHGLVQRDGQRPAVRPGPVLLRYASAHRGRDLVELASEALDRLAQSSGETVNLGIATNGAVEMLDQRDSRHYLGSTNWIGRRSPLHASAVGKVFLAYDAVPIEPGPYEQLAERTLLTPTALRRDLAAARARGYATAVDELEPGLWAVAAPVLDATGDVVAAIAVSGPTVRLHDTLLDELGEDLVREGLALSVHLGYDNLKRGAA